MNNTGELINACFTVTCQDVFHEKKPLVSTAIYTRQIYIYIYRLGRFPVLLVQSDVRIKNKEDGYDFM